MGSRYIITVHCPFCNTSIEEVYFAPTCGMTTQRCPNCRNTIHIGEDLIGYKESQELDMRDYSMWGEDYEEQVGIPPKQFTKE